MKRTLLAGAAFAALFATQAFAADALKPYAPLKPLAAAPADTAAGYIELFGAGAWNEPYWGPSYDPWKGMGGAGRLNRWLSGNMSAQFDFAGQFLVPSDDTYSSYYNDLSLYGAVHLNHRDDRHLLGVFGGFGATNDDYGDYGIDTQVFGGVEAQAYHGPLTFYGQVGYDHELSGYYGFSGTYGSDYAFNYVFAQGEVRWFVTPNTKISANIGMIDGKVFGSAYGPDRTYLNYGFEAEQKLALHPVSIFARYEAFSAPSDSEYPGTGYVVSFGARFHWGADTLLNQDRKGATLKVMQDLSPMSWARTNNEY